jgi:hypothetical protein
VLPVAKGLDFRGMDETDFEEFCFELLNEVGFVNVDWRKGTPKKSSPADRGRDIVAQLERTDIDGAKHLETWFVDCKHYAKGVPPDRLQGLLAWANAERPDVALVIASGYLSNPAKDHLKEYVENNRPPFRVKYWERPQLRRLTDDKRAFLDRFLVGGLRSEGEILAMEQQFMDMVWHERKLVMFAMIEEGREKIDPDILKRMPEIIEAIKARYPAGTIRPVENDFEWGMWSGKLSALRWVLGDDWDNLDT